MVYAMWIKIICKRHGYYKIKYFINLVKKLLIFFISFESACQYGFTGQNCELQVDFCSNFPCLNNGNCSSVNNTFNCQCPNGFGGK